MNGDHVLDALTRTGNEPSWSTELREWVARSMRRIEAEQTRSADTHLIEFPTPADVGVRVYLKDESTHITGSLKHRLARSLFLFALCNGKLRPGRPVIEASSGSTAISEAYFARLIGVPFISVVARGTSEEKLELIRERGGECRFVECAADIYAEAERLAAELDGHYMDQFTNAERATDWRGNNNIAESIFAQMECEPWPVPHWIVTAAGTGGTSATIGRYLRYRGYPTQLCVPDPEGSAFYPAWCSGDLTITTAGSSIEGIGRPRVEPSFVPGVIDRMVPVTNAESLAAARLAGRVLGRQVGPSTGTNLWATLQLAREMRSEGVGGSIVTILCDSGERYRNSYYDESWVKARGWDLAEAGARLESCWAS